MTRFITSRIGPCMVRHPLTTQRLPARDVDGPPLSKVVEVVVVYPCNVGPIYCLAVPWSQAYRPNVRLGGILGDTTNG